MKSAEKNDLTPLFAWWVTFCLGSSIFCQLRRINCALFCKLCDLVFGIYHCNVTLCNYNVMSGYDTLIAEQ